MNPIIGYVLIALAVVNLVGMLILFVRIGRLAGKPSAASAPAADPAHPPVADTATPAIDPDALSNMLRRLDNRLGDIEDQVRRGSTVTIPAEASGNTDRALALAQRLARQGASAKDIAETCGISLTEAELLHRLHAGR